MPNGAISVDQIIAESSSISLGCSSSIKSLIFLFIIVLVVLSTCFSHYVVGSFKSALSNTKEITSFGTVIQAVSIVILYALLQCLETYGIL